MKKLNNNNTNGKKKPIYFEKIDRLAHINKKFLNKEEIENIKIECTVFPISKNFLTNENDQPFEIFEEDENYIRVPKYYALQNTENEIFINQEIEGLDAKFQNCNIQLDENRKQITASKAIIPLIEKEGACILSLPCGYGKTKVAIHTANFFQKKTLVIVNSEFLRDQWIDSIKSSFQTETQPKITIYQGDDNDSSGDFVIAMLQSILSRKNDKDHFNLSVFGFVIVDEAHGVCAKMVSQCLKMIACKKMLALSATPTREDGCDIVLNHFFNKIGYITERTKEEGSIVNVEMIRWSRGNQKDIWLNHKNNKKDHTKMITRMTQDCERNGWIIAKIHHAITVEKRKLMVVSARKHHIYHLARLFQSLFPYIPFTILKGGSSKTKKRKMTSSDYLNDNIDVEEIQVETNKDKLANYPLIFGVHRYVMQAIDLPHLDAMFTVTPMRKKNVVTQTVGRFQRSPDKSKKLYLYDMMDDCMSNSGFARIQIFKKMGFRIKFSQTKIDPNGLNLCDLKRTEFSEDNLCACFDSIVCWWNHVNEIFVDNSFSINEKSFIFTSQKKIDKFKDNDNKNKNKKIKTENDICPF